MQMSLNYLFIVHQTSQEQQDDRVMATAQEQHVVPDSFVRSLTGATAASERSEEGWHTAFAYAHCQTEEGIWQHRRMRGRGGEEGGGVERIGKTGRGAVEASYRLEFSY